MSRRKSRRRWGLRLFVLANLFLAGWAAYLWPRTSGLLSLDHTRRGWTFPSTVYSAPWALREGAPLTSDRIESLLRQAGYGPAPAGLPGPGTYLKGEQRFTLQRPEAADDPAGSAPPEERFVQVDLADGAVRKLAASADGARWEDAETVRLEPVVVARFHDPSHENRAYVPFDKLPLSLKQAVIAVEDRRFYEHPGWDLRAIARAARWNLEHGRVAQGGSTLTQQLAKNLFLTRRRTFWRKGLELVAAGLIELRYTKDEILGLYLNQVYLGQDGPASLSGAETASRYYFGKPVADLDLAQSATIAGLIRSPLEYSPKLHPGRCLRRRNLVLDLMKKEGYLSDRESSQAKAQPLGVKFLRSGTDKGSLYFADEVRRILLDRYTERTLSSRGLKIFTTLDPLLQDSAEKALRGAAEEAAIVVMDAADGSIRALVGGRNYAGSQFNRATQARRQPGSAFKPFLYTTAFESWQKTGQAWTLASLIEDAPVTIQEKGQEKPWKPGNFDGTFRGRVTLARALQYSLNVPAARLTQSVRPQSVADTARRLGIQSPLRPVASIGLGTSEVTLLELASAYTAFATGGTLSRPIFVTSILNHDGRVLERNSPVRDDALDSLTSYLVTWALNKSLVEGTAQAAMTLGATGGFAGKTGTTDDGRDAWFVGYTRNLVAGVWVGDDEGKTTGLAGPAHALPLWIRFVQSAGLDHNVEPFPVPAGILFKKVDEQTGLLARAGCPETATMPFAAGTAPDKDCLEHPGGIRGLLQRWFTPEKPPSPLHAAPEKPVPARNAPR